MAIILGRIVRVGVRHRKLAEVWRDTRRQATPRNDREQATLSSSASFHKLLVTYLSNNNEADCLESSSHVEQEFFQPFYDAL